MPLEHPFRVRQTVDDTATAHIGTYALPGLRGRAAAWLVMDGLGSRRAAYPSVGSWLEVGADLL
ncbi:MAG: hypothetical protein O7C01_04500, partial [Actinobacteria bacterium]|nr:hypothetical protein [Actinomycetota bacterium]